MTHNDNIRQWSRTVQKRIAIFALVYLLLVGLGVFLLFIAYQWATVWGLTLLNAVIDSGYPGATLLLSAIVYVSVIAMCLMFGLFLVKFLFARSQTDNGIRVEVKEADCPKLFALIRETATATHCDMPHKVYLIPNINACVTFNTYFLSMFVPVKKNLMLGVGLFAHTNTEEIKGILAHEFGHFSQESMKMKTAVYTSNIVMYNLTYGEDTWDRLARRWAEINFFPINFFGVITLWCTNWVRSLLHRLYNYVNLAHQELSRQMEYDADAIACNVVGKDVVASGFYKAEWTVSCVDLLNDAIERLNKEGKTADPFEMLEQQTLIDMEENGLTMGASMLALKPIRINDKPQGRFSYKNLWDSHPSDSDRIAHLKDIPRPAQTALIPAWTLLPDSIRKEIGNRLYAENVDKQDGYERISGEELRIWLDAYNAKEWLLPHIRPFIQQSTCIDSFNPTVETCTPDPTYPFTQENRKLVYEYIIACEEQREMESVINGELVVKKAFYQDKEYNTTQLPMEEHQQYIESLEKKIKETYKQIYAYLISGNRADEVKQLYTELFEANVMLEKLNGDIYVKAQEATDTWNRSEGKESDATAMKQEFEEIHSQLHDVISSFGEENIRLIKNDEFEEALKSFMIETLIEEPPTHFSIDHVNRTLAIIDGLSDELWAWFVRVRMKIGRIAEEMELRGETLEGRC